MWGYRYSEFTTVSPIDVKAGFCILCSGSTLTHMFYTPRLHIADSPVFKLRGHSLGAMIAAPAVLIGWSSGLHRSYLRHVGLMPNGMPSKYPGYVEDETPYIVKHRVSDRRGELPSVSVPSVAFDGAGKAEYLAALGKTA